MRRATKPSVEALRLYRACLRSAGKCPSEAKAAEMAIYSRLRFEDAKSAPKERAADLIAEGWREVEEMEFYHQARHARNKPLVSPEASTEVLPAAPAVIPGGEEAVLRHEDSASSAGASRSSKQSVVNGLTFVKNSSYTITQKERHHKESGSAFDASRPAKSLRVREHESRKLGPSDAAAFSQHIKTSKPEPKKCLRAGTGMGGTVGKPLAEPLHASAAPAAGPSVKATTKRYNPPNTFFRKLFERGDLPIRVKHTGSGIRVDWMKPVDKVDLHHFLPVFVSGLREVEEPYMSLAQFGTQDLLAVGGDRLLPVVPQLVQPLREALATRDPGIVRRVMLVMQRLVTCGDLVGEALVPFYRQLLPVLSIFKSKHDDLGDAIDYGQRFRRSMGDLVQETLETLELHGGPDAFINLRYCVPTYESVVYTV